MLALRKSTLPIPPKKYPLLHHLSDHGAGALLPDSLLALHRLVERGGAAGSFAHLALQVDHRGLHLAVARIDLLRFEEEQFRQGEVAVLSRDLEERIERGGGNLDRAIPECGVR